MDQIKMFEVDEIRIQIDNLNPNKALSWDMIDPKTIRGNYSYQGIRDVDTIRTIVLR